MEKEEKRPQHAPAGKWDNHSTQRLFLDQLAKKLNIVDQQGWNRITAMMLCAHGGSVLLAKYNWSIHSLLSAVYPEYLTMNITDTNSFDISGMYIKGVRCLWDIGMTVQIIEYFLINLPRN